VALLVSAYLVLSWILASALSRGRGFLLFAAGLAALGAALFVARRGRRGPLFALFYVVLMGAVVVLAFEAILRVSPGVLSGYVADVAYSGYHWYRGGIYQLDDHMGPAMRPGVDRETYWEGRWWRHRANADGYRGPALARADVVFLGDSMIYGHGVEENETVAARFAARTGRPTANLGQQGTCQIQSWIRFSRIGVRLRPTLVFASVHFTDVADATQWYAPEELERLVSSPPGEAYVPFALPRYRPRPWWDPVSFWADHISLPLRCSGVAGAAVRGILAHRQNLWHHGSTWVAPGPAEIAAPFTPLEPGAPPEDVLGWKANVRSVAEIKRLCDGLGARLVLFDIGYPRAFSAAVEALAHDVGADYSPAGRVVLERAVAGEPMYLRGDGHWTPEGSDIVARELARPGG
jgi:hypothetical protein